MFDAKLLKPPILHVKNNSFTGLLIIGTFEKRAPGPRKSISVRPVVFFGISHLKKVTFGNKNKFARPM